MTNQEQLNKKNTAKPDMMSPAEDSLLLVNEYVEEFAENGKKVRKRGVYLLPNLLTSGALFCGFYAIVSAMSGAFSNAAIAIFVAMILDGLDGRVARLINAQSKFGAEYDSLSDMVSFGVAPALIAFSWSLHFLGKLGWMVAFVYTACAAIRLARFNTQIEETDSRYFTGLASPSAAALVAGMIWSLNDYGVVASDSLIVTVMAAFVTAMSGILMVTNLRYHSFKKIDLRGRVSIAVILIAILGLAVVFIDPPTTLLCLFFAYACSGPFMAIVRMTSRKANKTTNKTRTTS